MFDDSGLLRIADVSQTPSSALKRSMTAKYLTSAIQNELITQMQLRDRAEIGFFAEAPLVIDCRADAEALREQLTERQRTDIEQSYASGQLQYVSQLTRPAYEYARRKVTDRINSLIERRSTRCFLSSATGVLGPVSSPISPIRIAPGHSGSTSFYQ